MFLVFAHAAPVREAVLNSLYKKNSDKIMKVGARSAMSAKASFSELTSTLFKSRVSLLFLKRNSLSVCKLIRDERGIGTFGDGEVDLGFDDSGRDGGAVVGDNSGERFLRP